MSSGHVKFLEVHLRKPAWKLSMDIGVARILNDRGTPRPFKGYHDPGGWGRQQLRKVTKFKNFKMNQSFRKWINFSRISTFVWPEKSIFPKKIRKIEHIFQNVWIFSEQYLKIWNFQLAWSHATNPVKFPINAIINFRNLAKHLNKIGLDQERTIEMWMKIFANFGENRH